MTRDRGSYGPLDRDEHFVIGWGADRMASHAYARTVGAVVDPILPTVSRVIRGRRAAQQLWVGTSLIGGRGEADKRPEIVGQEFFHTVSDRTRAIAQLSTGFRALASDIAVWQGANSNLPEASATAQWIAADVTPTLEEWRGFVDHQEKSWWTKLATSWETFEEWLTRLKQLRTFARAHKIQLQSVEPLPLPKTIWQKSEEGKGSEATAMLGVLKIGALSLIGIMGAIGIYGVARELVTSSKRHHHDHEGR